MTARRRHILRPLGGRLRLPAGIAILAVVTSTVHPALSRDGDELSEDRLREIETQLDESRVRLETHQAEAERLTQETERIRKRSVEAALEVQVLEARLTRIESRLEGLLKNEIDLVDRLKVRQRALVSIIAALQVMERNQPPALLVQPDDAVEAARSAMLLGSVVPDIHRQAELLGTELDRLMEVRAGIERQRDDQNAASEALNAERAELADLLAEKERLQKAKQIAASVEAARVARFASEARDLRSLVEQLARQGAAADPRLKPRLPGQSGAAPSAPPPERLASVKGRLRPPVAGRIVLEFGDEDAAGANSEGIVFRTRPQAQIVAPFDSTVVFAQPYRNYGQVLILEAGDGYHFVLTGLEQIYGVVGQQLLAGEPVGAMGAARLAEASAGEAVQGGPDLYFELRQKGTPIDPLPWLSGWTRPVSG